MKKDIMRHDDRVVKNLNWTQKIRNVTRIKVVRDVDKINDLSGI